MKTMVAICILSRSIWLMPPPSRPCGGGGAGPLWPQPLCYPDPRARRRPGGGQAASRRRPGAVPARHTRCRWEGGVVRAAEAAADPAAACPPNRRASRGGETRDGVSGDEKRQGMGSAERRGVKGWCQALSARRRGDKGWGQLAREERRLGQGMGQAVGRALEPS